MADDLGAPESWEVADLDATMTRLGISSPSSSKLDSNSFPPDLTDSADTAAAAVSPDELFNQVDQFLREAIHNPRERLSSKYF